MIRGGQRHTPENTAYIPLHSWHPHELSDAVPHKKQKSPFFCAAGALAGLSQFANKSGEKCKIKKQMPTRLWTCCCPALTHVVAMAHALIIHGLGGGCASVSANIPFFIGQRGFSIASCRRHNPVSKISRAKKIIFPDCKLCKPQSGWRIT